MPVFDIPDRANSYFPAEPGQTQPAPSAIPPGPPPRQRRRRSRLGTLLGCLFRVVLAGGLFVVLFTAMMVLLYRVAPPPRTNILVLGLDARPEEGMVARTDTLMLITVDPARLYVGMLSIPRDLYVEIPGYGLNRINAAHVLGESEQLGGGPALVARTVEHNFGVPVHRTLRLNFDGFVSVVDAAGGVTIDVPDYIVDYEYPTPDYGTMVVEFQPGVQHMDGARALQYARIRHGSSDFERAKRQQQVIDALARQLLWPSNWGRLPDVYDVFIHHVDTNLTVLDIAALAPTVVWVGPNGIDQHVLDGDYVTGITTDAGAEVLQPQWSQIRPLLDEMFYR